MSEVYVVIRDMSEGEELIRQRIACPELGYPESEALYGTIQEWEAATGMSWADYIDAVMAERELAKDAARYRWLKDMAALSEGEGGSILGIVYSIVIPTGVDRADHVFRGKPLPDIDAAIDAAMEEEG